MFFAVSSVNAVDCNGKSYSYDACNSTPGCKMSSDNVCVENHKVKCGNITKIPEKIPELVSFFITAAEVIAVVILVIMGSIDLFKGLTSSKEDEIKKGQQLFVKKLIMAAVIFFIVAIVKLFVGIVADKSSSNIIDCIDCFIDSDSCEPN